MHRSIVFALSIASSFATTHAVAADAAPALRGKQCFHLDATVEKGIGYCQAVLIGDTLHISGSVGAGDMPAAIEMAYETLKKTLAAHQLSFRDVVRENVFTTDLDAFIKSKDVRRKYYIADDFPAATWVQVQRLYDPSFVVEVELVAIRPNKM